MFSHREILDLNHIISLAVDNELDTAETVLYDYIRVTIMKKEKILRISFIAATLLIPLVSANVWAWNNGGYTEPGNIPQLATHDWIALHAASWLPENESWWILDGPDCLSNYLLGTELPDNGVHPWGIGDTALHHVYYDASENLEDDSSAVRAQSEFNMALAFLEEGNYSAAALHAGIMSHYIVDVGVFGHVMGSGTDWGSETHHSDYESHVETRTNEYPMDDFSVYLSYDGDLSEIDSYNATLKIAYDTTFDVDGYLTCIWMDTYYDWSNATFRNRAGESLNLCVNYLTDVLHTLYTRMTPNPTIANFDTMFRNNEVSMVYPDTVGGKALNCGAAWVTDWLASAFVYGHLKSCEEGLDTDPNFIDQVTGNAMGEAGKGIICFGGQFVSPLVKYAESEGTKAEDRAPIKFHLEDGTFRFQYANGTDIPGAELPQSVINIDEDMFVIEVYKDGAGRYVMLVYGFGWKGTYAAGKYFEKSVLSNFDSYKSQWIIVRWEDANGDGFVNSPGGGDSYTMVATG